MESQGERPKAPDGSLNEPATPLTDGPTLQPRLARWLPPLLIPLLTFLAFSPTLGNGFVNWDDERNFLENPHYRGLGWAQLRWMATTFHLGVYQPLSWGPSASSTSSGGWPRRATTG